MIPTASNFLNETQQETTVPTRTYRLHLAADKIAGYTDGAEAMKQAIYLIIGTERYRYVIYSWQYGIELEDLFGMPMSYCIPEVERRITEALSADDRILRVYGFSFVRKRESLAVTFSVETVFGEMTIEKEYGFHV